MKALVVRVVLAVTSWSWVRRLVTRTRIGRRVALRFVAGETLDDAVAAARRLNAAGMAVSLDHLGEHVSDPEFAARATDAYLACIERIVAEGLDANISIKLTQLGLGLDDAACAAALARLAEAAVSGGTTITIDMEESAHTAATIAMFLAAQREHGNLGLALQAYLRRTPDDLDDILAVGGHVRLCKGAYDESEAIAYSTRREIDDAFDDLTRRLMAAELTMPAIATHDGDRVDAAIDAASTRRGPWEFQMLYGIRESMQRRLVEEGHAVRVYVPYGDSWYPYLTRRLGERPANTWFFVRALFGR